MRNELISMDPISLEVAAKGCLSRKHSLSGSFGCISHWIQQSVSMFSQPKLVSQSTRKSKGLKQGSQLLQSVSQ